MSLISSLPHGYSCVAAAVLSAVFLQVWQTQIVVAKRKKAGIQYPQVYATAEQEKASYDALIFNCAQRAHQNTLEALNNVYVTTIIAGLKYPIIAASVCGFWVFTRVLYTRGYITGEAKKRITPLHYVGVLGLIGNLLASTFVVGTWAAEEFNLRLF
ncbi:membrane-associated proteins in eicosanoid and glutathione metabolism [Coprinellus micaceus]|uniref:Membrane-associated proteins in eicosanoid and glutathione metabolism n=1 Tax=Coprinellus micaceus TaxID=71717 RepID=A0A4Y7TZE2_COPMI|nr:membrane-associated proteins in eicosanoid and glutathione metabolism [Coprinellus micaceus]